MPNRNSIQHPVRDVVLPLAVVIGLLGNALGFGIAWGKITSRVEVVERAQADERETNAEQSRRIEAIRDQMHVLTSLEAAIQRIDQRLSVKDLKDQALREDLIKRGVIN